MTLNLITIIDRDRQHYYKFIYSTLFPKPMHELESISLIRACVMLKTQYTGMLSDKLVPSTFQNNYISHTIQINLVEVMVYTWEELSRAKERQMPGHLQQGIGQPLFQDKRYREQAVQASVLAKDSPVQCSVETSDSTSQYSRLTQSDASTQASRVRHHVATQHYPEARDNHTDTCNLLDNEIMDASDDSAIDVDSNHGISFSEVAVQHEQETVSKQTQMQPEIQDNDSQANIPDPELSGLQDHISELEIQRRNMDKILSPFYIPVQYSDYSDEVDLMRNYLNNMISVEGARSVALHPGDEKLADDNGYLTAANNSPVSLMRRSDTACNEEGEETDNFSSFETESIDQSNSDKIQEELRVKLDLAYKVGASRRASHVAPVGCSYTSPDPFFDRICVHVYAFDVRGVLAAMYPFNLCTFQILCVWHAAIFLLL